MNRPYQELVEGECLLRHPPGTRHETICARLHDSLLLALANQTSTALLPPRSLVEFSPGNSVCPDLALYTVATGKVWLVAEVIDPVDHQPDTVLKKALYEDLRLPRLWMVDPRFDNVEIYHGSSYGLNLRDMRGPREFLTDKLLPGWQLSVADLFAEASP